MRKPLARVVVTAYALEEAPYPGKSREEAKEHAVARIAARRINPVPAVETKEELNL